MTLSFSHFPPFPFFRFLNLNASTAADRTEKLVYFRSAIFVILPKSAFRDYSPGIFTCGVYVLW
jgi:hypothetical protein